MLNRRRALMFKTSRLPSEYQEVAWVGSNSTSHKVLLNPNIALITNKSIKFEIEIKTLNNSGTKWLCGVGFTYAGAGNQNGHYCINYGASQVVSSNIISTTDYDKVVYEVDCKSPTCTETLTVNDDLSSQIMRTQSVWRVDGYNAYIFNASPNAPVSYYFGSCKSAKIYFDNVLVRDFIPCYRKSDNVVGMYDLIGETFYTSIGESQFDKGENV